MLNIVSNVLWYAVGISVLFLAIVFIHEFGHFIVAKLFGIKVEVFSIGFGPKILKKKWGETEYCLSILPLGGYVKIHGQEPGEKINPSDTHAFANKPVWQRSCVVAAGPIFNFLLTVTLLFLVAGVIGRESVVSSIGYVESGSYAESQGFQEGDKIVSIEKSPVQFWREDVEEIRKHLNLN
ncbi:MAG: RIP metalloprotease RseP [Deltaproteobacteria bacterium]|nr:RIP metalloprotease RseP [Deltaproteobacteria bacterium]